MKNEEKTTDNTFANVQNMKQNRRKFVFFFINDND